MPITFSAGARLTLCLTIVSTWLAAAAPAHSQAQPQTPPRTASAAPAAPPAPAPGGPSYTLHPGDELEIAVWKETELQKPIVVRPDGRFSFPLVGEIAASGRTLSQVQAEIETKLKKYIPDPVVSITLTNVGGNKVYVIGQVRTPGAFIMNPQMNVLQALSLAGGMTPFAALNNITIVRSVDGRQSTLPFRYEDVSRGRNLDQNVLLESGDVVVVP